MGVTIKEVAEYAGVSRGTVDRVIHKRGYVKKEVEEKVQAALRELQYEPNTVARALAMTQGTVRIGVLIPGTQGFFKEEVLRGIHQAKADGRVMGVEIDVSECDVNTPADYLSSIEAMLGNGVKGFAICAQDSGVMVQTIDKLEAGGFPVITLNSDIPESKRRAFVGEDSYRSGRIAGELTSKILSDGDSVLVIGGRPQFAGHVSRVRGFEEILLERFGKRVSCDVIYTYEDYRQTCEWTMKKLSGERRFAAVYLATNQVEAYAEAVRKVSADRHIFSVCHDIPASTLELLKEGIVDFTIEQNMYRQGYKPLKLLWEHLLFDAPIENDEIRRYYNILSAECVVDL